MKHIIRLTLLIAICLMTCQCKSLDFGKESTGVEKITTLTPAGPVTVEKPYESPAYAAGVANLFE